MLMLRFLGTTLALSVARDLAYRWNFALALAQALVLSATGILTIGLVYRQTGDLAGWSQADTLVLFGMFQVMSGLLATFVEPNTRWFGNQVRSGAIDDVLADHRMLTGPRTGADLAVPGVVRAVHSDRHTDLLVRTAADRPDFHPAWQAHPVGLEELILAYLERPAVSA